MALIIRDRRNKTPFQVLILILLILSRGET